MKTTYGDGSTLSVERRSSDGEIHWHRTGTSSFDGTRFMEEIHLGESDGGLEVIRVERSTYTSQAELGQVRRTKFQVWEDEGEQSLPQSEAHKVMKDAAKKGKKIARAKNKSKDMVYFSR